MTFLSKLPWYVFALCSGMLLILSAYPFYWWPLAFVALAPLFALAGRPGVSLRHVFGAGGVGFAMLTFVVVFLLVVQFHWLPAAAAFVALIRGVGLVGVTVGYGLLFGASFALFKLLRSSSATLNVLLGAALYCVAEVVASAVVGGYYLAPLAHAALFVPPLVGLAALGGAFFVSFCVAFCNVALAELVLATPEKRGQALRSVAVMCSVACLLWGAQTLVAWRSSGEGESRTLSVAVVQRAERSEEEFVNFGPSESFFNIEAGIDLVIYPGSVVAGLVAREYPTIHSELVVAEEAEVKSLAARLAPASTLMAWNNGAWKDRVTTGFQFYREGDMVGEKYKQSLLPFMDYAPSLARRLGIYTGPFDVVPGPVVASVLVEGSTAGALVCSEAVRSGRARVEARSADFIVAAGSEAMFVDDGIGLFTLRSLQYRAVENNIPIVRASLFGPSAFISKEGKVMALLPQGEGGTLRGTVIVGEKEATLFNALGYAPLAVLLLGIIGLAFRTRFLRTKG